MIKKNKYSGMTLLELMIAMAMFSIIMISILSTVQSMYAARIKSMNRIHLTEQLHTFGEQLFTEIKNGGTLDYEEYWNRTSYNTDFSSGHYTKPSGLGNYGSGGVIGADVSSNVFSDSRYIDGYYCASGDGSSYMGKEGCLTNGKAVDNKGNSIGNQNGKYQIYGQYARQFWDFNGNRDNDRGDEDGVGGIIGDEDDKNQFIGPRAFTGKVYELYLINKIHNTRTFFRWNIIQDPRASVDCSISKTDDKITTNDGCLGNIQILKTKGEDYGFEHKAVSSIGAFDGKIDTWICKKGWACDLSISESLPDRIATGKDKEWVNLFPSTINVKNFSIETYPEYDPWLSAVKDDCSDSNSSCISPFIHPYIRISLELGFSHGKRRTIKGDNPIIPVSTTINLDDFYTNY